MKNIVEEINWEEKYYKSESRVIELEALIRFYEEQIRLAKQRQFGASSEKTMDGEQLGLFNEAESSADPKAEERVTIEEIAYARKKRVGKRADDLSNLPIETIEYELPEYDQVCPECGGALHSMSTQERCEIEIIPAAFKVKRHLQHVYSCRDCEKNADHTPIVTAPAPEPLIRGSLASASAVAYIMVEKYVKAVPLYRQEQSFRRDGLNLSRQTMANWVIRCAEDWLKPIYNRMRDLLLREPVLHADETVVQVLNEPGKKANTNSYEWLYRTSGCAKHPIALYEYQPTRSSAHPKAFLKGWKGYLHTDGYQGYHNLPDITVVGCWAHARRKFEDALKALPMEQRSASNAKKGEEYCNRLFELEREFAELTPEKRLEKRLTVSLPIAEAFLVWAKSFTNISKSLFRTAIEYLIGQWPFLSNVFLNGSLELSNNRAERSIKPFVIGRKNWLFSNSQNGAHASSIVYSIIETAKENGLKTFGYLKFLMETVPNTPISELERLLPWGDMVPLDFKVERV